MTQRATPPVAPRACGTAPTPATTTTIATTTPPPPLSSSSSSSSCASRRRAATVQYVTDKGDAFAVHIFAPHTTATTNTTTASADAMAALLCREAAQTTLPVLFCVHGAGMSGDNFTRLADHLHGVADNNSNNNNNVDDDERVCAVRAAGDAVPPVDMYVVAYDMRCHGASTHAGGGEAALTLRVLVDDCVAVLRYTLCTLFPRSDCYALGHSLGGAVVVQALSCGSSNTDNSSSDVGKRADVCGSEEAVACMRALRARVCGVVMLDVVEGTARQSLRCMRAFLQKRPDTFASVQDACAWFLQCGGMRSADGAAVSVPPLLQRCDDDNDNNTNNDNNDDDDGKVATSRRERWVWRTNLHAMHAVWDGWFVGLDSAFVQLTCPRMLCLANVERLDTALTIAQMRGQFQLEIVGGNCGHYIMDDAPAVLAQKLQRFVWRVANMQRLLQEKLRRAPPPPSLA